MQDTWDVCTCFSPLQHGFTVGHSPFAVSLPWCGLPMTHSPFRDVPALAQGTSFHEYVPSHISYRATSHVSSPLSGYCCLKHA